MPGKKPCLWDQFIELEKWQIKRIKDDASCQKWNYAKFNFQSSRQPATHPWIVLQLLHVTLKYHSHAQVQIYFYSPRWNVFHFFYFITETSAFSFLFFCYEQELAYFIQLSNLRHVHAKFNASRLCLRAFSRLILPQAEPNTFTLEEQLLLQLGGD